MLHFLLCLSLSALALATPPSGSLHKRCSTSDWDLTVDNYNAAGTDAWVQEWWESKSADEKSRGITTVIADQFLPTNRDFTCGINKVCTVGDCESVSSHDPNARQAYFFLESISRFTQAQTFAWTSLNTAEDNANAESYDIVTQFFTEGLQLGGGPSLAMQELLTALIAIISIVASYFSFGAGLAVPFMSSLFQPEKALQYSSIAFIEGFDVADRADGSLSDAELDALRTYSHYIASIAQHGMSVVANTTTNLLNGQDDGNGKFLWDYLGGGSYLNDIQDSQETGAELMTKMFLGGGINALWSQSYVYIVAAPEKSGVSCENDTRGPSSTKFCRGDGRVYYAYTIPSHGSPHAQVLLPQGSDGMGNYGFSIQDAIESSIKAWYAAGFNYNNVRQQRWLDAMANWGIGNRPVDLGVRFEGVFTIPVCYDPTGQAISAVKTNKNRNYPCACGVDNSDTAAFRAATHFDTFSQYRSWCHS